MRWRCCTWLCMLCTAQFDLVTALVGPRHGRASAAACSLPVHSAHDSLSHVCYGRCPEPVLTSPGLACCCPCPCTGAAGRGVAGECHPEAGSADTEQQAAGGLSKGRGDCRPEADAGPVPGAAAADGAQQLQPGSAPAEGNKRQVADTKPASGRVLSGLCPACVLLHPAVCMPHGWHPAALLWLSAAQQCTAIMLGWRRSPSTRSVYVTYSGVCSWFGRQVQNGLRMLWHWSEVSVPRTLQLCVH